MPESKMSKQEVEIKFPGTRPLDVDKATGEIIKGYQKIADGNIEKLQEIKENAIPPIISEKVQKKIAKTVKAVIAAGMVASPFALAACAKEVLVVEEKQNEEKGQVTIPSETKETTPPTTTEETVPPTTEAIPQTVEYKGSVFPLPEGSEANSQTGEIFAIVGNPYGVEAGTKIGQCIKDAFELNRKMENSIALTPPAIEYLQKKIMEENKEFKYALPFYPAKGIKITEIENKYNSPTYTKVLWDEPKQLAISGIPLETKIYSPVSTSKLIIWQNDEFRKDWYTILFGVRYIGYNDQYDLEYKGNSVDTFEIVTEFIGAEIIPPELKEFPTEGVRGLENMRSEIGAPLAKFKENKFLPHLYQLGENAEFSMLIYTQISQWDLDKEERTGFVAEGLSGLLTMKDKGKKEEIIVSFMPANE